MDLVSQVLERTTQEAEKYKPITVKKHLDLEYDLGTLLASDTNDFDTELMRWVLSIFIQCGYLCFIFQKK